MPTGVRYLGWGLTLLSVAVYLAMVLVTLPHLAQLAGGMPMFDMRPLGYDFGTAQDILTRLGTSGAQYYEDFQHRLDFAFPIMAALTLIFWMIAAARRWQGHGLPLSSPVLAAMLALAILANAADLGENAAISAMLAVGPKALTFGLVQTASTFTLAKTFFSTLAYLSLIGLAVGPWVARLLGRGK